MFHFFLRGKEDEIKQLKSQIDALNNEKNKVF